MTRTLISDLCQASEAPPFLGGDPDRVEAGELGQAVHSEAGVRQAQSEGVSLKQQGPQTRQRTQSPQQHPVVLEVTETQVETQQLWPGTKGTDRGTIKHPQALYWGRPYDEETSGRATEGWTDRAIDVTRTVTDK